MKNNSSLVTLVMVFTLCLGFVLGCGGGGSLSNSGGQQNANAQPGGAAKAEGALSPSEAEVSREEFGAKWPLTVDRGVLSCNGSNGTGQVFFTAGGKIYAVNGLARGTKKYPPVDEIWADNPAGPGPKKDIGPIIERGLKLCR